MRWESVVRKTSEVEGARIGRVSRLPDGSFVLDVKPYARFRMRCPRCRRKCPRYDRGSGRRRWRAMDSGSKIVYLEAESPRVECHTHGVITALVPWARRRSRFTRSFEDRLAWLAAKVDKTSASALMRVSWSTVGDVISRVVTDALAGRPDPLEGLRRISIDEKSYRKRHKYLVIVTDIDENRVVWMRPNRTSATVEAFFKDLGPDRCATITHVGRDAAEWIAVPVTKYCPNAMQCLDPFHVVKWMTDTVDLLRREIARGHKQIWEQPLLGSAIKGTMWLLRKGRENLTDDDRLRLADLLKLNRTLYRAYVLKEALRHVFQSPGYMGWRRLLRWISWARRCRIPLIVELSYKIEKHLKDIENSLMSGVSSSRSEALNGRVEVILRRSYGFHSAEAVMAIVYLCLGGVCPPLRW